MYVCVCMGGEYVYMKRNYFNNNIFKVLKKLLLKYFFIADNVNPRYDALMGKHVQLGNI